MRPGRKRAGAAILAVAALGALSACSGSGSGSSSGGTASSSSATVNVPGEFNNTGVPVQATGAEQAGTITVTAPPNSSPTWILPIATSAAQTVFNVRMFDYQMYPQLFFDQSGVEPTEDKALSLANDPVYSNGDKTVTLTLKSNFKWSDGKPITSQDLLFWYDEMKAAVAESPANWEGFTPDVGIPDQVASVATPNASTFVFNMKVAVNPSWFTEDTIGAIQPMPSFAWAKASANGPILNFTNPANATKIYNFLSAQSKSLSTYATNPLWQVVDGPYKLTAFNTTSGAFTMVPNKAYGGPHAKVESNFQTVSETSDASEYNAVKSGSVDIGYIPSTDIANDNTVKSAYNVFGYDSFGFDYVAYNFKDTTGDFNNIIGQLYIRQAIAHLEDEPGYIKAFFDGAGDPAYGPVPKDPESPYTPSNAVTDPYPFSVSDAVTLLKSHGWNVVPGGTDTCAKPGTSATECGAGIPEGTKLSWNLIYTTDPTVIGSQIEDLASEAKQAGITMNLSTSNFNFMVENYDDASSPKDINDWAMMDFGGFSISTYPTTFEIFNTGGGLNIGGYSNPTANKLIMASISSSNPNAVLQEASYITEQQPGLFQPDADDAFGTAGLQVWKKNVSGPPASLEALTQSVWEPQFWFLTK
jgi:peptide/nickel transport system substrate-binding protein